MTPTSHFLRLHFVGILYLRSIKGSSVQSSVVRTVGAAGRETFARHIVALALAVAVALPLAALASPAKAASEDLLPDLGMAQLTNLKIEKTRDDRKLLRFSSVVVNVGDGPFEVHGKRTSTNDANMQITQRIFNDASGYRDATPVSTTSTYMYFGGDGHSHWHVRDLESFELKHLDKGGTKVGTNAKHGFCFFDNTEYRLSLPGAPQNPYYKANTSPAACAPNDPSALDVLMGLSVGWGDLYPYSLPDQYIDITGLGPGRYRLEGTVDADGWFEESNVSNNSTWVDIRIKKGRARVIGYGPSA
jgi:hypothetical protein